MRGSESLRTGLTGYKFWKPGHLLSPSVPWSDRSHRSRSFVQVRANVSSKRKSEDPRAYDSPTGDTMFTASRHPSTYRFAMNCVSSERNKPLEHDSRFVGPWLESLAAVAARFQRTGGFPLRDRVDGNCFRESPRPTFTPHPFLSVASELANEEQSRSTRANLRGEGSLSSYAELSLQRNAIRVCDAHRIASLM